VDDLHPFRLGAQPGERVDEPLGGVRGGGQLGGVGAVEGVALVVDNQQPAVLADVDVHDAVDEQGPAARAGWG
jgi:hypothetical protein